MNREQKEKSIRNFGKTSSETDDKVSTTRVNTSNSHTNSGNKTMLSGRDLDDKCKAG